ncbi:hypothetical protein EYR40_008635 [Pleurotus pulmonarius]|nr:hypothetical protein EYR40_008635 [Pleurotus pulmonarius]
MLLVLGIPVLSLLTVAVALRNISIDDSFGDESTHDVPTYTPPSKWTVSGRATPNASLAYKGTWHDTTSHPLDANHTASFSFTGVSLYVYCIIANTPPPGQQFFDTFADYIFFLDKEWVGNYEHDVEKTHDFFYNVPVYVNQTMENKLHSFSIVAHSNDRPVLLLFDYAIYTSEDNTGDATSSARKPKVTYTSREENGPESHVYLGTISDDDNAQKGLANQQIINAPEFPVFADTLTLNGVTRPITKLDDQGNTAITYKVGGSGWPDPSTKKDVTAYAKSGKAPGQTHDEEIKWLTKVQQLLDKGKFNNLNWIVFRGVDNKFHITNTDYWLNVLYKQYLSKGNIQGCKDEFKKNKIPLIIKEAKYYVDKYKVLHTDIQPGNLLWDKAATSPTLIDWGRAKDTPAWTAAIEEQVRKQAEFSHLEGEEQICVSF